MNFNVTLKKILVIFTALKATIEIKDDKELEKFVENVGNLKYEPCPICTDKLLDDGIYDAEKIKSNLKSFLLRHSLILCPFSSKHVVHKSCLVRWFLYKKVCPVCTSSISTDYLEKLVFNMWYNFYKFDDEIRNGLVSQLEEMNILKLVKVLKIFKFNFGENRLEDLKRYLPHNAESNRLEKIIDAYNKSNQNNYFLFISENIAGETKQNIKKVFTRENLSNLKPLDLLEVCQNLDEYFTENYFDFEAFYKSLDIKNMQKYAKFFTYEYFNMLLSYGIDYAGNFKYLKDICARMYPHDLFDESLILESIHRYTQLYSEISDDFEYSFLECFMNFYGLKEVEFYERIFVYMINNREIISEKGEKLDMAPVFSTIFIEANESGHIDIIEFLDSIIISNAASNQFKDNLVELLMPLLSEKIGNDVIFSHDDLMEEEDDDDEESVSDAMEEDIENDKGNIENDEEVGENVQKQKIFDKNYFLLEEDYGLLEDEDGLSKICEAKKGSVKKYENILESVISNQIIGKKFLEEYHKKYNALPKTKFKKSVEYYESKISNAFEAIQSSN